MYDFTARTTLGRRGVRGVTFLYLLPPVYPPPQDCPPVAQPPCRSRQPGWGCVDPPRENCTLRPVTKQVRKCAKVTLSLTVKNPAAPITVDQFVRPINQSDLKADS